ncbi:IS1595 family transposase ISCco3 [subsurface metagenome]
MRYIELFAGIGGFRYGLEKANNSRDVLQKETTKKIQKTMSDIKEGQTRFTCVFANEWNKYACQIYQKNFGNKNIRSIESQLYKRPKKLNSPKDKLLERKCLDSEKWDEKSRLHEGDIRSISAEFIPDHDLLTAGFPCQSFSIAGKRKGFKDTRGTLFFEICRIAEVKRPRLLLLENVQGLLNHDKGNTFRIILSSLSELGYDCEWEVLNSKDFGVPQNRPRVFIIGHLRGKGGQKVFPIGKDDEIFNRENKSKKGQTQTKFSTALRGSEMKADHTYILHNKYGGFKEKKERRFYDYSPTIRTPKGGGHIPDVVKNGNIRCLTPTECERLQGFPDGWTEGISDTQRYKCLGNAVTTNVIMEIGKKILEVCNIG